MIERVRLHLDGVRHSFTVDTVQVLAELLRAVFVDLVVDEPAGASDTTYRVEIDGDGAFHAEVDGAFAFSEALSGELVTALISSMNRVVSQRDDGWLSLHAALLVKDGAGLVLAGEGWSGKSTLAVALTKSGWAYGGDEVVGVHSDGSMVVGFPKPITLKRGTRSLFADLPATPPAVDRGTERDGEPLREYLPASTLGEVAKHAVVPRLVVLLGPRTADSDAAAPGRFDVLAPGAAVIGLVNSAFEQQISTQDQLLTAARLASRCVVASVPAGELHRSRAVIEELWARPHTQFAVGALPWSGPGDVAGVLAGDTAVLGMRGQLLMIDPMPAGLWKMIETGAGEQRIAEAVAAIHGVAVQDVAEGLDRVFAELRHAGVLPSPDLGA